MDVTNSIVSGHLPAKMIYPKDFRPKQNAYQFNVSASDKSFDLKMTEIGKAFSLQKAKIYNNERIWIRYCSSSTVHGLRYLAEPKVTTNERYNRLRYLIFLRRF